jgi:hypothetical protein
MNYFVTAFEDGLPGGVDADGFEAGGLDDDVPDPEAPDEEALAWDAVILTGDAGRSCLGR